MEEVPADSLRGAELDAVVVGWNGRGRQWQSLAGMALAAACSGGGGGGVLLQDKSPEKSGRCAKTWKRRWGGIEGARSLVLAGISRRWRRRSGLQRVIPAAWGHE